MTKRSLSFRRYVRAMVAGSMVMTMAVAGNPGAASASSAITITVWTSPGPSYSWQVPMLKAFENTTGINVNYVQFPETTMTDKLLAAEEVHSGAFAMFEDPESQTSSYLALDGIAPIGKYLNNSTLTPASYNWKGIPQGEVAQCTINGVIYCLPVDLTPGPELFYNKAMFAQAGLTPPSNWAQVQPDADKLTTPAHSGICMRGSETAPNGYPVLLMLPYFLPYSPQNKGEYLSPTWQPLFNTPQALTWANEYAHLMQKDAPRGVSAYDWTDCQSAFYTGKTAMWWDDAAIAPTLYTKSQDPQNYMNAGFDEIPCASFNQSCILSAPWGMYINPNASADQQVAAYKLMEYLTSPSVQIKALTLNNSMNTSVASRPATVAYAIPLAARYGIPADYLKAIQYATQHVEPNAIPVTAAFTSIQNVLFVILSQLITAEISPSQALQQLQTKMTATLKTFHL